jgi:hypothetical protein
MIGAEGKLLLQNKRNKLLELYFSQTFTLVSCLNYFLILKMEATCSSETSVEFQRIASLYIREDGTLLNHSGENFKSYTNFSSIEYSRCALLSWTPCRVVGECRSYGRECCLYFQNKILCGISFFFIFTLTSILEILSFRKQPLSSPVSLPLYYFGSQSDSLSLWPYNPFEPWQLFQFLNPIRSQ